MTETVGHFVSSYLPITETFIYQYLTNHEKYEPFVCATFSENEDLFEFKPKDIFMQLSRWNPKFWIYGLLAKLNIIGMGDMFYSDVLRQRSPTIVHAHFGPMGVEIAGNLTDTQKLVTSFYGYDVTQLTRNNEALLSDYERLFDHGDLFLVEGPAMKEKVEALGCQESKIAIQRIAIDTSRIVPEYPAPETKTVVLMVGRFVEKKGFPDGIKAFASVFSDEDAELRIVGGAAEYGQERLEEIAAKNGIRDQVTFLGYLEYEEYLEEVHSCSLLLAPSKRAASGDSEGGAPTVLLEAQASGKPIVSTTHADIPYVVEDGNTGILVSPGNVSELAEALQQCTSDYDRMKEMGQAGVDRMKRRHDIQKLSNKLESRYDEIR